MARARVMVAMTISEGMQLGSMWRKMIERTGIPAAMAACTKSWLRRRRNSARPN